MKQNKKLYNDYRISISKEYSIELYAIVKNSELRDIL